MPFEIFKGRRQAAFLRFPRAFLSGYPLILLIGLLGTIALFSIKHKTRSVNCSDIGNLKWNSFSSYVQFNPRVEIINETEIIWQIPDSAKAVLFLAHGCNGRAANFWDRSPSCQHCVGLPEERLIALQALYNKYAVLSISSLGRCWSFGDEERRVQSIIQWWVAENKLHKLPLMALGASSGGVFDSITVRRGYPPTLFVHMPKDHIRKLRIKHNMESLGKMGVVVGEAECRDFPLSPRFLSDRVPCLDEAASVKLFEIFRDRGFIDEDDYLKSDGRAIKWKEAVKDVEPFVEDHECAYHVQEELNLAYGYHEMTSLKMEQIVHWFESHLRR